MVTRLAEAEIIELMCPGGEMVYTLVLGTSAARRGGSNPLPGTNKKE